MFTVELFDRDLRRRGRIPTHTGSCVIRRNGAGTFQLDIPPTQLWNRFEPGWHITLTTDDGQQILSGQPDTITTESKAGIRTVTVSGRSHLAWLADTITLPNPKNPADKQTDAASWTAKGPADQVAHNIITSHLGPTAHHTRRRPITIEPVKGIGHPTQIASRFQPLIDEVRSILADNLVITSWLENAAIHLSITPPSDYHRRIRLSEASGGLTAWKLEQKAPTVTDVLVAGQGQGASRTLHLASGNRTDWDVSALAFQDRRDTDDFEELKKAGTEALAEGQEQASISVEVADQLGRRFLRDFTVGDTITVALASGVEIVDIVQSGQIDWSESGMTVKLQVGPTAEELDAPAWVRRVNKLNEGLRRITAV